MTNQRNAAGCRTRNGQTTGGMCVCKRVGTALSCGCGHVLVTLLGQIPAVSIAIYSNILQDVAACHVPTGKSKHDTTVVTCIQLNTRQYASTTGLQCMHTTPPPLQDHIMLTVL